MERVDENRPSQSDQTTMDQRHEKPVGKQKSSRNKKTFFGLAVLGFGIWWLLRRMDIEILPYWVMTWPMLLIVLGVFNLFAHNFRNLTGYVLLLIGGIFMARNVFDIPIHIEPYFWPVVVIVVGLTILFKPHKEYGSRWKKKREKAKRERFNMNQTNTGGEKLNSLVVMGAIEEDVISKDFQGGDITVAMAGADINFAKADIQEKAVLDVTVVAGGVKLVVPTNWNIQFNTTNILGGVEDNRRKLPAVDVETKTLVLTGTVMLGGIEVSGA